MNHPSERGGQNIQALIFDLGGVVFDCTFRNTFEYWSKLSGVIIHESEKPITFGTTFEKFERGEIEPEEFAQHVSRQLGIPLSFDDFKKGWNSIYLNIIPGIDDLLQELKSRYRIVALTNTNAVHTTVWPTKYASTLRHFEKVFSSHQIKTRKPEAEAFETVLNYLELSPGQALFLDDKEEYTTGAQQSGIHSVQVNTFLQMKQDMNRILLQS